MQPVADTASKSVLNKCENFVEVSALVSDKPRAILIHTSGHHPWFRFRSNKGLMKNYNSEPADLR
jgi:hypothetical protein